MKRQLKILFIVIIVTFIIGTILMITCDYENINTYFAVFSTLNMLYYSMYIFNKEYFI